MPGRYADEGLRRYGFHGLSYEYIASALLSLSADTPGREGDGLTVPVTVVNSGDESTGRQLAVAAQFILRDGKTIDSDFKTVYDLGLAPSVPKRFSLKVPKVVAAAGRFRVHLTAREGVAAGIAADSALIGLKWPRSRGLTRTACVLAASGRSSIR